MYSQELIMPNKDIPFKMFLFEGMNGHYVREKHWHREIEIFAVFEGDLDFYIGDREYPLKAGDFILVNSNEVHSIKSPHPNMTLVVQIPLDLFENYIEKNSILYFKHFKEKSDEEVMAVLREMYGTYVSGETGYEFKVLSQFYQVIYILIKRYRETRVGQDLILANRNLDRLSRITDYMQSNYTEELTLEGVAETFSYTPTYISHMFRKYAGTTFKTYLQNLRLEHGYRMLNDTNISIGDIAMRCGFASSKSFSTFFHRKYGIMPGEFRKRIKK